MTDTTQPLYDAIIIGGGPAGLTCAIFLGRYRRRVLVIDEGNPRNYATPEVHGFLGQHGVAPAELLARGRAEAEASGVEICRGRASAIVRNGDCFEVTTTENGMLRARRIVLAYGIRDTLPEIPEFASYYGITAHHCPDCDGYEASDARIGVIGWTASAVGLALKLLQWSNDIVVLTDGHQREWDDEQHSKLLAEQIDIHETKVASLEGMEGRISAAILSHGERIEMTRIFFHIHTERTCSLAEELGCECDDEKPNIVVDDHRRTTVDGVWAVGDLVEGSQLAVTAAADGAIAAIDINKSLLPPGRLA